jgi:hypothetical protein
MSRVARRELQEGMRLPCLSGDSREEWTAGDAFCSSYHLERQLHQTSWADRNVRGAMEEWGYSGRLRVEKKRCGWTGGQFFKCAVYRRRFLRAGTRLAALYGRDRTKEILQPRSVTPTTPCCHDPDAVPHPDGRSLLDASCFRRRTGLSQAWKLARKSEAVCRRDTWCPAAA